MRDKQLILLGTDFIGIHPAGFVQCNIMRRSERHRATSLHKILPLLRNVFLLLLKYTLSCPVELQCFILYDINRQTNFDEISWNENINSSYCNFPYETVLRRTVKCPQTRPLEHQFCLSPLQKNMSTFSAYYTILYKITFYF